MRPGQRRLLDNLNQLRWLQTHTEAAAMLLRLSGQQQRRRKYGRRTL